MEVRGMKNEGKNELISVIAAALAAFDKRTGYRLVVKSFRRIPQTSPVWSTAAKLENNNHSY
jgi:hypothetical protein